MKLLSKAKVKLFTSLSTKKNRYRHGMFIVEGWKMCREAYDADWPIEAIILRQESDEIPAPPKDFPSSAPLYYIDNQIFDSLSQLVSPEGILTVLRFPNADFGRELMRSLPPGPGFLLDGIQDPGNMGTILRIADWFGFSHLICNKGTVDFLNAKTLRSSMGSVFRVQVCYPEQWESLLAQNLSRIWVADMQGEPLGNTQLGSTDYILLGNEANGISERLNMGASFRRIHIPGHGHAESLNVGVAAGILAWELCKSTRE